MTTTAWTSTVDGSVRVLVTGSRTWPCAHRVTHALGLLLARYGHLLVVVHGACPTGVDAYTDTWCRRHGVRVERYPANWKQHGRLAGLIRNTAMVATRPALCLAFVHNASRGATHCAQTAAAAGIPVTLHTTWGTGA